jgi:hypothetical protein
MSFADTPNKQLIRSAWDLPILQRRRDVAGRPLAYFGLCGTELYDLRDWRTVVGPKCCVEAPGNTAQERNGLPMRLAKMRTNAQVYGLSEQFQPLRGLVEDVLLNGVDERKERPRLTDVEAGADETRFRYDLYNLDFDGGLGYANGVGDVRRTRALGKLFERQAGQSFTLFLTVNVRDTIGGAVDQWVADLEARQYGSRWRETLAWHRARGEDAYVYLLKAAVPIFLQRQAESRSFRPRCYAPIVYQGHAGAVMVHFALDFDYVAGQHGALGAWAEQEEQALLDLPLLRSADGVLSVVSADAPGFDRARCAEALDPLPPALRELALGPAAGAAGAAPAAPAVAGAAAGSDAPRGGRRRAAPVRG